MKTTREHCAREHVWKIYFSVNYRRTRGKRRTTCAVSYVKIFSEIGKSSRKHGRKQKFRQTRYPLSCEHPLCLSNKPTRDGSQRTVREPHTVHTNIVFANTILIKQTSCSRTKCSQVYTQLYSWCGQRWRTLDAFHHPPLPRLVSYACAGVMQNESQKMITKNV